MYETVLICSFISFQLKTHCNISWVQQSRPQQLIIMTWCIPHQHTPHVTTRLPALKRQVLLSFNRGPWPYFVGPLVSKVTKCCLATICLSDKKTNKRTNGWCSNESRTRLKQESIHITLTRYDEALAMHYVHSVDSSAAILSCICFEKIWWHEFDTLQRERAFPHCMYETVLICSFISFQLKTHCNISWVQQSRPQQLIIMTWCIPHQHTPHVTTRLPALKRQVLLSFNRGPWPYFVGPLVSKVTKCCLATICLSDKKTNKRTNGWCSNESRTRLKQESIHITLTRYDEALAMHYVHSVDSSAVILSCICFEKIWWHEFDTLQRERAFPQDCTYLYMTQRGVVPYNNVCCTLVFESNNPFT